MPIELSIPISILSQNEFHAIDKVMMGHAIAIHNEFGRLLDESIYKTELAGRCQADRLDAKREVLVRVRHGIFVKDYFIDLLLGGSTVTEVKTAKTITEAHRGQGINYLLLAGTHHGSLANFRPPRLKREFLSTQLTHEIRSRFTIHESQWPKDADHDRLREIIAAFCTDVGLGLDVTLYREAFATLAGKPNRHISVLSGAKEIGHHEMHLLNDETGLAVTALTDTSDYRTHLQRLLAITSLKGMAWVNLRLGHIDLIHLNRQNHEG